jgi:lysophospholipase L1-like esterase
MRKLKIGLTVALLLVANACQYNARLPPLDRDAVVLAFGDSLTFGTGAAPAESYPAQLQGLIGRKVIDAGVPGEISEDGLARLPTALDESRPALLILCHGGNDFLRKLDEGRATANVRAMVKLARDRGIAVVLLATPKPGLLPAPAPFYEDIAKEFSLPIEKTVLTEVLTDNSLKSDLVHPNAKGYGVVAGALAKLLKKAGAI